LSRQRKAVVEVVMLDLASSDWLDLVQTSSDGLEREYKLFN
jgi:hypothetical protein